MIDFASIVSACSNPQALIEQIPDTSITASSFYQNRANHGPQQSRYTYVDGSNGGEGAWVAWFLNTDQWIQADFGSVKAVVKVATKGRNEASPLYFWLTKYRLKYGLSANEDEFEYVRSAGGDVITFDGNSDKDTGVENEFEMVFARVMRLCPVEWNRSIAVRWELYGC